MHEPLNSLGIGAEMWRQELDRNLSVELYVTGLVDYAHPTLTELLDNLIMRNCISYHIGATLAKAGMYVKLIVNMEVVPERIK